MVARASQTTQKLPRNTDAGRRAVHDAARRQILDVVPNGVVTMIFTQEMARERTRDALTFAQEQRVVSQLRSLQRAKRNERKAERRLIEAWQARNAVESALEAR